MRTPVRPIPATQTVSAPVLAVLIRAAEAHAAAIAADQPDAAAIIRRALDIVAPIPCSPAQRKEALAAGYHVSKGGGSHYAYPPANSGLGRQYIGHARTRSAALDLCYRDLADRRSAGLR